MDQPNPLPAALICCWSPIRIGTARIPYVIDNIAYRLAGVLNDLLQREQDEQVDIATAYFSIRGFELLRHTLPGVQHFRLLLGDKPLEGEDIGLRPDSAAYLLDELNAEPFTEATSRLVEELIRFLRRDDGAVRLYLGRDPHESGRNCFLHAKCYLFYGGRSGQSVPFDHLHPIVGIVGSSNFTDPGLSINRELNLVHKTLLEGSEIDDPEARGTVSHQAIDRLHTKLAPESQRLLKSEIGARPSWIYRTGTRSSGSVRSITKRSSPNCWRTPNLAGGSARLTRSI